MTGETVELAYVDRGYTGAESAAAPGLQIEVVTHPEMRRGFVLLPRYWVIERDFA